VKDYRAVGRYAGAFFALAEESGELDRLEKELAEATLLVRRHSEISNLIRNSTISREEKEDFIEKILPAGSSALLVNFLKVIIRKKRFENLAEIQDKFHRLYEDKKGLQRVRVSSPVPLGEILEEKLKRVLQKRLGRTVYLETSVNPEILGGFLLDFDGTQIDGSFRTALQELKQRLLIPYAEA
jgi:F-type H+-transporting ATPase subunit delta